MPASTTLHSVFKRLEVRACETVLQEWVAQARDLEAEPLVLDGKALRGIHGEELPVVRLVGCMRHGLFWRWPKLRLDQRGTGHDRGGA